MSSSSAHVHSKKKKREKKRKKKKNALSPRSENIRCLDGSLAVYIPTAKQAPRIMYTQIYLAPSAFTKLESKDECPICKAYPNRSFPTGRYISTDQLHYPNRGL